MKPKFDASVKKSSSPLNLPKKQIVFSIYMAFLSFCVLFLLNSCSKETDCCTNIDTSVDVFYRFDEPDAFNPESGRFTTSDINVEYLIGTDWISAKENSNQGGFQLFRDETYDAYILRIFPDYQNSINTRSVRITIGDLNPDVLKVQVQKTGNAEVATKVWVNNSLQWDMSSTNENEFDDRRMVSIIK